MMDTGQIEGLIPYRFERKSVMIYTNKEDQPIIKIQPTLPAPETSDMIILADTSISKDR